MLAQRVWWPNMLRDIKAFVRGCPICQHNKDSTQAPAGLLQPVKVPHARFEVWSMDFITDLPMSNGFNAVFTSVDALTKYTQLTPCFVGEGHLAAPRVARLFFDAVVRFFGCPRKVLHNRDPRFTSNFWCALWRILGVSVALSSAYYP